MEIPGDEILPSLLAGKPAEDLIRIWSAGCASGEGPYSIAMLLVEAIGLSEFRRRMKIYATDIDEEALEQARRAVYSAADLKDMSPERFFEASGDRYGFRPELRRSVIFGRHDLVKDPPRSRLDLIVCRNVPMYLNALTQSGVFARFQFALNPAGILFLGRAEMLLSHTDLFAPVEIKHRVFTEVAAHPRCDHLVTLAEAEHFVADDRLVGELQLRAGAFDAVPLEQIVIDSHGSLVLVNRSAKELFGLTDADLRRLLQDLDVSYRPLELRSLIDRAYQEEHTIRVAQVEFSSGGENRFFEVEVTPLRRNSGVILGVSVSFSDTTQAYHSATEELETTNEELQSTNEELRTMNDVLQDQSDQLEHANTFLESVSEGLRAACVVVDSDWTGRVWKGKVEDLWGLRAEEVEGQPFASLDIGLPVDELEEMIRACLRGKREVVPVAVDAINRRGQRFRCNVIATPLFADEGSVRGAILLMEPENRSALKRLGDSS